MKINIALLNFLLLPFFLCTANSVNKDSLMCRAAEIMVDEKPASGWYKKTNGKEWTGIIAPYTLDYAVQNGVDTTRLVRAHFPALLRPDENSNKISISSYRYSSGNWRFVRSNSIRLYELVRGRSSADSSHFLCSLSNDSLPYSVITNRFTIPWCVTLSDTSYNILSRHTFSDTIRHKVEDVYDMIYTYIGIDSNMIILKTMYAHTGSGTYNQEFTTRFCIKGMPLRLEFISTEQTLDEYDPSDN